jgi:hypothetical protein
VARNLEIIGILAICLVATVTVAQSRRTGGAIPGTVPNYPLAEFHFARAAYDSHGAYGGSSGYGMPMWAIDWPDAEEHFMPALERFTRVRSAAPADTAHIQLTDDRLFDYPWLFMQQAGRGQWDPSQQDAERLREYLMRGGFLVVDDMHGEQDWLIFENAIKRVLPGRPILEIAPDDALLNIVFDMDQRTQIPGERHLNYDGTASMQGPPHWRAIYDDDGRMIVAINYNIDMGDAWEHADDAHYPVDMTSLAYRFGVNYLIYAMTH